MPDFWGLAAILTKFALYLGVLGAAGTAFTTLLFRLEKHRNFVLPLACLGFGAALLGFSLRGANLTGDASGMTDPEMLALLWSTPVGTALALRILGLAVLVFGLFVKRGGVWFSALGGLLALYSFNHVGHVSGRETTILDVVLFVHLSAIALWIGILCPLKRLTLHQHTWADAAHLGHRFGNVAMVSVPILILVGGYMGYALVGSFSGLFGTGYGQALVLKVLFVAILLGFAAANKLRFTPGLRAGDPKAAKHLATSISLEWLVIVIILGVTALLTSNLTLPT